MQQEVASVLVSFFLESLLFGAFVVTYTQGTWRLLQVGNARSKPSRRECAILLASTVMFVLALVVSLILACIVHVMILNILEASRYNSPNHSIRGQQLGR